MHQFRPRHDGIELALANFSLTFAKALLVFCVVLFVMISPPAKDGTKPKAEFLITVDWIGSYDVDTWTRLPDGTRVSFKNRESGVVFLERDDLGNGCVVTGSGGTSKNVCEEIVVLRGIMPGEYILALHLYSAFGSQNPGPVTPIVVHVKIERLNPMVDILWQNTATLDEIRQEKGLTRFTVTPDGHMVDFNVDELPSIVYGFDR